MNESNRPDKLARFEELTKEVHELLRQSNKGDKKALARLGKLMNQLPEIRDALGDLAEQAEIAWIGLALGKQEVAKTALRSKLAELKREIAGHNPSVLETLLAERIAACWLQVQYADAVYAQNLRDLSLAQSEHSQRRQDRAHHRYLSAIKCLAQIRKLGVHVLQVNIGQKQINVVESPGSQSDSDT